jgi:hypothetical protein
LTSWNVFSHHFFEFCELSFYGTIIWIDSWNVFSHHFFGFFDF